MDFYYVTRFIRNMKTCGILSVVIVLVLLHEIQSKAVESLKHGFYSGPTDSSSYVGSKILPVYEEPSLKYKSNIATLKIGKPLHFEQKTLQTRKNYESESDQYDLSNYENLEGIFDTKSQHQEKLTNYKPFNTKLKNDGGLQEDQVFLHETQIKPKEIKYQKDGKPSNLKKTALKSSDIVPPCDVPNSQDYKNKSLDGFPSSINVHEMVYGNQFEHKSPSNIHEPISEDFHQYETKIIHKNVHQVPKNDFELNFQAGNKKSDESLESKLETSKPEVSTTESSKEILPPKLKIQVNLDSQQVVTPGKELVTTELNPSSVSDLRSFVFNPNAQSQEVFQECKTSKNEFGHCRYIQHCMLPSILSSIRHFMDNVCIIRGQFIGVCCPEFPVNHVLVNWPDKQADLADDSVEFLKDCGVGTNRRIVGGLAADRKSFPWMVALLNNKKKFFCGGSLINNRYVLTAAHCTFGPTDNRIVARLGEYDFNDPRDPHDDYFVTEIKRHGQYARFTLRNDIALLKLERPVVFNEFVKTICLPEPGKDYLGETTSLAGWGHLNGDSSSRRSNVLQEASLKVMGNDECGVSHGVPVASSVLCAASPEKDKGACNGDSGGPLMLLDGDERWKVVGIVSWGRRGCNPHFPTAYSRVTHYLDWIKEHAV